MSDVVAFNPRAVRKADDLVAICRDFLHKKQLAGLAENTVMAYRRDLEQFVGFVQAAGLRRLADVRVMDVDDWLQALVEGEGNSRRTVARKHATLREFFRFAVGRNLTTDNVAVRAEGVRFQLHKVVAPDASTIRRFLNDIDTSTALGTRDRAMFELMADSALRVSGLTSLDVYDPDDPPDCAVGPTGIVRYRAKGGSIKTTVYTSAATGRWLDRWLAVRHTFERRRPCAALFLSERGTRLSRAAVHARIKHWAQAAGLPHLHCHLLRHRRLGDAMKSGDVRLAQALAGHENASTTLDMYGHENAATLQRRLRQEAPFEGVGE